jgi:hypothetical protein
MTTMQETSTNLGRCHDCAQGLLEPVHHPFNIYKDDDGDDTFWYCTYCGSNHVDILDNEGNVIFSQGNLYD